MVKHSQERLLVKGSDLIFDMPFEDGSWHDIILGAWDDTIPEQLKHLPGQHDQQTHDPWKTESRNVTGSDANIVAEFLTSNRGSIPGTVLSINPTFDEVASKLEVASRSVEGLLPAVLVGVYDPITHAVIVGNVPEHRDLLKILCMESGVADESTSEILLENRSTRFRIDNTVKPMRIHFDLNSAGEWPKGPNDEDYSVRALRNIDEASTKLVRLGFDKNTPTKIDGKIDGHSIFDATLKHLPGQPTLPTYEDVTPVAGASLVDIAGRIVDDRDPGVTLIDGEVHVPVGDALLPLRVLPWEQQLPWIEWMVQDGETSLKHLAGMHNQALHDPWKNKLTVPAGHAGGVKQGEYDVLHVCDTRGKAQTWLKKDSGLEWKAAKAEGYRVVEINDDQGHRYIIIKTEQKLVPKTTAGAYVQGKQFKMRELNCTQEQVLPDKTSDGYEIMHQDDIMRSIIRQQGYDGLPEVVGENEMDALVADGNKELHRGVCSAWDNTLDKQLSDEDAADVLRYDKDWRFIGGGMYGAGTYTGYQKPGSSFTGYDVAHTYGTYVSRMVLRKNAKVADYDTMIHEASNRYREIERVRDRESDPTRRAALYRAMDVCNDAGRYAASQGYDAIEVPYEGYVVVLNRTALIIQKEEAYKPPSY